MKRDRKRLGMAAALAATSLMACLGVVTLGTVGGSAAAANRVAPAQCRPKALLGSSEQAAEAVVGRYVRTVVVRRPGHVGDEARRDACGLALHGVEPAGYETSLPRQVAGWWQLAPRIRNARGFWEYAGFLHLAAPDAAPAAFQFLLELRGNRWFVSSFEVAPGSAEFEPGNAPT